MNYNIGVIGLGYVGIPLALAFAREYPKVVGYDISTTKVKALKDKIDPTGEGFDSDIAAAETFIPTNNEVDLKGCNFFVVTVPTPVNEHKQPDLTPLKGASETLGRVISKGAIVVFESTVYPGVTEEYCAPIIEKVSGLTCGKDFFVGYSPERINPGDKERTVTKITKVVSGQNAGTLETVAEVYGKVVKAGVFKASSIKVAEAAKVIENTQRDLNIALMNELSIIFDKIGISTKEVLDAAGTKWNFLKFTPGLVGGHCIGVDPYYLTQKAESLGYFPQVILAGRRINDGMGAFIAQKAIKLLVLGGRQLKGAKVGVFGLTFKEDVTDIRNSKVPDIVKELKEFGVQVLCHEPHGSARDIAHEYGIETVSFEEMKDLDCGIYAVSHREYVNKRTDLIGKVKTDGVVIDVKGITKKSEVGNRVYWSL
jgi:UDP-N-acetyl-D-galactosamine dehydrogenase